MDEEEDKVLMCLRVEDATKTVDGSIVTNCHECEALIYLSVSGQKIMATEKNVRLLCGQCCLKDEKLAGNEKPEVLLRGDVLQEAFMQIIRDAGKEGAKPRNLYNFVKTIMSLPVKQD